MASTTPFYTPKHPTDRQDDLPSRDDPTDIEPRPRPAPDDPAPTTAQLRRDIDSGATGDKVGVIDPAATPLGTDAEAAGAPPTPEMVRMARDAERMANPPPPDPGVRLGLGTWLVAGIVLAVLLGVAAAVMA